MKVTQYMVRSRVNFWRELFNFDKLWKFHIHIYNAPEEILEEDKEQKDSLAFVGVESGYHAANIYVNSYNIVSKEQLDEVVAHEMTHVVLNPLWIVASNALGDAHDTTARNLLESATERISRALLTCKNRKR